MSTFAIEQEYYAGPLETLLDLIESRKLSVSLVSLSEVCDAYLAYVEKLPELPLSQTSQFVLVASTLLLIKSRSLLPTVSLSNEEELSIEELERRLKRYARIRAAAKLLKKEWGVKPLYFARRSPSLLAIAGVSTESFAPGEATTTSLLASVKKLISTFPKPEKLAEATVAPVLRLEDVIVQLKSRIATAARARWSDLTRGASRHDVIVHFLAVLELVRNGSLSVTQERLFSDMTLESDDTIGAPKYG